MHLFNRSMYLALVERKPNLHVHQELSELRRLAGELNSIGHGLFPPVCFEASELLQLSSPFQVPDLVFANNCLRSLRKLKTTVYYNLQYQPLHNLQYLRFADASLEKTVYVQIGYISRFHLPGDNIFIHYIGGLA